MKRRRGMTAHRTAAQRHVLSVPQVRLSVQRLTFPVTGGNATCALRDAIESELFLTRSRHPRVELAPRARKPPRVQTTRESGVLQRC